ncbi:MAG: hypothetical protein HYX90_03875 [Chloroflexi bacterium]|nr:hypothetical protein [Chloroflexota bacterium]
MRRTVFVLGLVFTFLGVGWGCSGPTATPTIPPATTATTAPAQPPSRTPNPATTPTSPSPTQTAAPSFAGKTIIIIVPFSPASTSDLLGRLYARFLPNYLPGKPNLIVRNMPGGAATIGTNFFYNARPDGLTMLAMSATPSLNQLMGMAAVKYDLRKTPAILGVPASALFYSRAGTVSRVEDLPNAKGLIFGYTPGSVTWTFLCAKELLNIPTDRLVLAYSGSGDARRAFISGEINMSAETGPAYKEFLAPLVQKGEVLPLFQSGLLDESGAVIGDPILPPAPTAGQLYEKLYGKAPSGIAWKAYTSVMQVRNFDKVLLMSPGTPNDILKVYTDAATAMLKDPEFQKAAVVFVGEGARWMAGPPLDRIFKAGLDIDPEVLPWLRTTLTKYGMVVD